MTKLGLYCPSIIQNNLLFWMRGLRVAMCIALCAVLPAFGLYQYDRTIRDSVHEAQTLPIDALWIDARSETDYAREHVPGALNLNEHNWDHALAQVFMNWQPPRLIVVYCSAGCSSAAEVAAKLTNAGVEPVMIFEGGFEKWKRSRG